MSQDLAQLADVLARAGTRHAFGVTGSGPSLRLITELVDRGVEYHAVLDEGAAAIMAGTVACASARPAAAITIKGPGLTNMLAGVSHNHFEGNPAVSISEAYASGASARMHKRLDQAGLVRPLVKRYATLAELDCMEEILAAARVEEPGPIHIDLAQTAPTARIDEVEEQTATSAELERALERLKSARRPVIIVGSLLARLGRAERLATLAVPVFTTVAAKGALDERLPHAAGVFTGAGGPLTPESLVIPDADLVVGIGLRAREVIEAAPLKRPTVLFDTVRSPGVQGFGADVLIVPLAAIDQVLDAASEADWGGPEIERARERLGGSGLGRSDLAGAYFAALDADTSTHALVSDTGLFCIAAEHVWRASPDRPFFGSSCGRYMGVGLPMALGLAFENPRRPVVCAVGDGGVGTYIGELRLAVEHRMPLCVVLFADGRYGSIAAFAPAGAHAPALVPPVAEWWRVAEGLGLAACRIESVDAFTDCLSRWDRATPLFIEIRLNPDAYVRMTEGVR